MVFIYKYNKREKKSSFQSVFTKKRRCFSVPFAVVPWREICYNNTVNRQASAIHDEPGKGRPFPLLQKAATADSGYSRPLAGFSIYT